MCEYLQVLTSTLKEGRRLFANLRKVSQLCQTRTEICKTTMRDKDETELLFLYCLTGHCLLPWGQAGTRAPLRRVHALEALPLLAHPGPLALP